MAEAASIQIKDGKLSYLTSSGSAVHADDSYYENENTIQIPESTWVTQEFYEWFQSAYAIDGTRTNGINIIPAGTYRLMEVETASLPLGICAKINFVTSNGISCDGIHYYSDGFMSLMPVSGNPIGLTMPYFSLDYVEFTVQKDTLVGFAFYDWFNVTFELGTMPVISAGTYQGLDALPDFSNFFFPTELHFTSNSEEYQAVVAGTVSLGTFSVDGIAYISDFVAALTQGTGYVIAYSNTDQAWSENYKTIILSEDSKIMTSIYPYFPYIYTKIE